MWGRLPQLQQVHNAKAQLSVCEEDWRMHCCMRSSTSQPSDAFRPAFSSPSGQQSSCYKSILPVIQLHAEGWPLMGKKTQSTQFGSSGVPSVQSSWYWKPPYKCLQDCYKRVALQALRHKDWNKMAEAFWQDFQGPHSALDHATPTAAVSQSFRNWLQNHLFSRHSFLQVQQTCSVLVWMQLVLKKLNQC